jgi:hypothetical protein
MSAFVKVFGCRPHDGGAAHTGAGVRKPPMEETAMGERAEKSSSPTTKDRYSRIRSARALVRGLKQT